MGHVGPEGELGGGHLIAGASYVGGPRSCDTSKSPFDQIGRVIKAEKQLQENPSALSWTSYYLFISFKKSGHRGPCTCDSWSRPYTVSSA